MPAPRKHLIQTPHFLGATCLLALASFGPFFLRGIWGWSTGLVYIGYDTFLLLFVGLTVAGILRRGEPETPGEAAVSVAVLVPARNEGAGIFACLEALRGQAEPAQEILVVDDGSTDDTVGQLTARYRLEFAGEVGTSRLDPSLRVLRKAHSGKADSLNRGWSLLRSEVVVTLDADTIVEAGAVRGIRRAFAAHPRLAAAGGTLVPTCLGRGLIARALETYQRFEYIRAFLSRRTWMEKHALLLVSGAFAAYRRETVRELGGFDRDSLVEDYEIIHRIHRARAGEVQVLVGARARTDSPDNLLAFLRQRRRWFAGFLQTQFRNVDMIGNPAYGNVGKLMLPVKSLDTLQPVYGVIAFALLIWIVATGRAIEPLVLRVIGVKIAVDLCFHFWSIGLYARWQRRPFPARVWLVAILVTMTEPFSFQLLRHLGACWGWLAAFRRQDAWTPGRGLTEGAASLCRG